MASATKVMGLFDQVTNTQVPGLAAGPQLKVAAHIEKTVCAVCRERRCARLSKVCLTFKTAAHHKDNATEGVVAGKSAIPSSPACLLMPNVIGTLGGQGTQAEESEKRLARDGEQAKIAEEV